VPSTEVFVAYSDGFSRGWLSANGLRTLNNVEWCFPRSEGKRTVCERCERFANAPFQGLHGEGRGNSTTTAGAIKFSGWPSTLSPCATASSSRNLGFL